MQFIIRYSQLFCIFAPMKTYFLLAMLMVSCCLFGGNHIYSPRIQTVTSIVNGDWLNRPVMDMGNGDVLEIGFDEMSHTYHRLVYRIEHCEADWSTSEDIFEIHITEGSPEDDMFYCYVPSKEFFKLNDQEFEDYVNKNF